MKLELELDWQLVQAMERELDYGLAQEKALQMEPLLAHGKESK
jgi:hypothetical protein